MFRRNTQGMSLVEMLVLLIVIAIIMLSAIPNFLTFNQEHRLSGTAEELFYSLLYARSEAVKRGQTVYVTIQTGDTWCYGINTGSTCTCTVPSSCNLGTNSYTKAQTLSLSGTGLTNNSIQFEGTRGSTNASSTLTFTLYGQSKLITINITKLGNMQFCSTQIAGYPAC